MHIRKNMASVVDTNWLFYQFIKSFVLRNLYGIYKQLGTLQTICTVSALFLNIHCYVMMLIAVYYI
jgi:hypothetical protein